MRTIVLAAVLMTLGAGAGMAAPGTPIGSAVMVVSNVTADLEAAGAPRRLFTGDDVRQQELIEVDKDGRSEIVLNDDTKLALGGAIVMNLVHGAFRFITGVAAKPAYVIRTPNASITVRGTIFDVYTVRPNETWLLLLEGGVEACTNSGRCVVNDQPGKLIRISDDDIDGPQTWNSISRGHDITFNEAFPFVVQPPLVDPEVIFTRADIVGSEQPKSTPRYEEKTRQIKPKRTEKIEIYTPPPRKVRVVYTKPKVKRVYVHKVHVYPPKRRRYDVVTRRIKRGVALGIGLGVGYKIAKALKGGRRY
jgi:hypothetical protein